MSDRDQRILDIAAANGAHISTGVPTTLDSPAVPEALGHALAEQLRQYQPTAVVFWSSCEASVLCHVVARELGVNVLPAYDDLGRLSLGRRPENGATIVAVDVEWADYPGVLPLIRTVAGAGGTVVAVGTVLYTSHADAAAGVPLHVLEPAGAGGAA
jgi:hypothetical protein